MEHLSLQVALLMVERPVFFELAVMKGDELCYDTPITDDVVGWLKSDEVNKLLDIIERLQEG